MIIIDISTISISINHNTFSMLIIIFPFALIFHPILIMIDTISMSFVNKKVASELSTVFIYEGTFSMFIIIHKISYIFATIAISVFSFSFHIIILEITLVIILISKVKLSFSIFHAKCPLAFIGSTRCVCNFAIPIRQAIGKCTPIFISIAINFNSITLKLIVIPCSFKTH